MVSVVQNAFSYSVDINFFYSCSSSFGTQGERKTWRRILQEERRKELKSASKKPRRIRVEIQRHIRRHTRKTAPIRKCNDFLPFLPNVKSRQSFQLLPTFLEEKSRSAPTNSPGEALSYSVRNRPGFETFRHHKSSSFSLEYVGLVFLCTRDVS